MKMTQPTQDTDITSSISPLFNAREDLNENVRTGNDVRKLAKGRPRTSFIMDSSYAESRRQPELGETTKCQSLDTAKSLGENFPWIVKFSKVIQSAVGSKNPKLLDRLLSVYSENMSREVNTCYSKPYRAAKLKTHISETLMFFHLYWRNIKERVDDHNQYLDKMSEILGLYVDMELKASRRGKDSASKIAAKLLTAMFIYLDNSEEHMFRILFRVKFITKNYNQICGPIFTKLFDRLSGARECDTGVTYVRYLLAFKLWKRIKDDLHEKKKINELAVAILGQRIPSMTDELAKIIPKPPDCHRNGTLWLLQPNSFDLRKACDDFVIYEISERIISLPESMERLKVMDNVDMQIGLEPVERLNQKDVLQVEESVDGVQQIKKVVKLRRFKPSFPKLRPGEVVFIDLTSENDDKKQGDGKKKKKRDKKKLKWLKEVSKRSKLRKENKISDKTCVEKANAHSTDNCEEGIEKTDDNSWPISEDKITESTQRIQSTSQSLHRFGRKAAKVNPDTCGADDKQEKIKCDTEAEISENLVTSQTSLLNNDAMVLINGPFVRTEIHNCTDSFGETDYVDCRKQELRKGSGVHSSTIISNSYKPGMKMMKQEPEDIIDDSTTDKNCDKIILTDLSSFNINKKTDGEHFIKRNLSSPTVKLKVTNTDEDNATFPSTSSAKNIPQILNIRGKSSKARETANETCVVSTTALLVDFTPEDQINVISGSTNEPLASHSTDIGPESFAKQAVTNSKKLFSASKYKPLETSKNCYKNDADDNKLQNSLIHALSLDEIIQIGRDDVDSQSEDDEDKGYCSKMIHEGTSNENSSKKFIPGHDEDDFFQIPDIQLCDDLTNDNEGESLVTTARQNKVDDFENIDILDSILNGDMSMQDILEEQQHMGMNSASNDTSANMLGFFTEFFKQSEITPSNEKDCETEETLHLDKVTKSLPEGSLGMTGILNSLLDSDLTSIDSPPSDFMYSNVQTVDPRLIRKSPTAERAAFLSDFSTLSDQFSQKELSDENFPAIDSLSKKTKDQLFLDQKDSLNCTDLEEFSLNSTKETTFEMPVLEEELIQLPQHPLIDETIITQISPVSCESPSEVKATLPSQDFNNIQLPETNYGFTKLSNFQEFTSLRLKDIIQHSASEIDHGEDLPTSTLTDFTPPQSVDAPQSPYTFASSPAPAQAQSQTVPHSPTHSVATSRHNISANMLTPPPSVPLSVGQNNLTPPPTPQQNQNSYNDAANSTSGNFQRIRIHHLAINSIKDDTSQEREAPSSLNRKKDNCEIPQAHVAYTAVRTKKSKKAKAALTQVEDDEKVRLTQIQVALTRLAREEINGRASGEQSLLKNNILVNRDIAQRQLQSPKFQRIDLREFSIAAQQNKPVFINLNGKTKPALVFERNIHQGDNKLVKSLDEDVNSRSNIVYKLTSNVKPTTSKDKPYSKLPKVNFTVQKNEKRDLLVGKPQSTITRYGNNVETSKETQKIVRQRCSTRRVKAQASKSTKELNTRKTFNVTNTEEPSLKKRKITSKFLPMLENEGIIYSVNQQKAQEKHSNVIRRDFVRKDRTKKKVV